MEGDSAIGRGKRAREVSAAERGSGGSAESRKRVRGVAGDEIVFECTICGKACSNSSDLTTHMHTHSGIRPYACTTCRLCRNRNVPT